MRTTLKIAITPAIFPLLALSIVVSHPSSASCLRPSIESTFRESDVVFAGTVVSKSIAPEKYNQVHRYSMDGKKKVRALQVRFRWETTWKGKLDPNDNAFFYVVDPKEDGSAGYNFEENGRYVVFARYRPPNPNEDGEEAMKNLWTDLCYGNIDLRIFENESHIFSHLSRIRCEEDLGCEYIEGDADSEPEFRPRSNIRKTSKGYEGNLIAPVSKEEFDELIKNAHQQ